MMAEFDPPAPGAEKTGEPSHGNQSAAEFHGGHRRSSTLALALGSVGVVYGDIGTSPLYAMREALAHTTAGGVTRADVTGVVSLLLWSLMLIVTIKYVFFILFADNKGEGGTLSLLALARGAMGNATFVFVLGVLGAALFYGDAMITPAISVLSAVEGLELVAPGLEVAVVPLTILILVALFAIQNLGTGRVSAWFGPITAFWFLCMAVSGAAHVGDDPAILAALDPRMALGFLAANGVSSLIVLGSVFLAVTGAEALYADMGHFGRKPIQLAWIGLVFPSLTLNYLGQGALVLDRPGAVENPFFLLVPDVLRLPYVALATIATVIASQAVITGAYSLTRQAVQLGLLPRLEIRHTSETQAGQIYMPRVNWALLAGVLALVVFFRSSGALAAAYGISVTGQMVVTSLLAGVVVWKVWGRPLALAVAVVLPFLAVEAVFLGANLLKVLDGGYVPLALAALVTVAMWTWVRGTRIVWLKSHRDSVRLDDLRRMLETSPPAEVPGTAVYLTSDPAIAPSALLHNLKHNHVLHARNVILTVDVATSPRQPERERIRIDRLDDRFIAVTVTYGYMEEPNVPRALGECRRRGLKFDIMATSFFLSRRSFKASPTSGMPSWQDRLFIAMSRQAANATDFYRLPTNRVLELGQQFTV